MNNTQWNLEDFIDSLVIELDKMRETLAVKAINKPLTYTVKDLAMDLNIFPTYDGDQIRFITAQPGQEGASKVSIQLGSITDQQVRATTKMTGLKNETNIDEVPLDKTTRKKLRKIGVVSVNDLKQVEKKNVDIKKVTDSDIDYADLANQLLRDRRNQSPPRVRAASLDLDEDQNAFLSIKGENLSLNKKYVPVVVVNNQLADVIQSDEKEIRIRLSESHSIKDNNDLIITFDPYAIVKMNIKI